MTGQAIPERQHTTSDNPAAGSQRELYLDAAASDAVSADVINAMIPFLTDGYGNPSSVHASGKTAARALDAARASFAADLGARPNDVIFTSGGTEADNLAIKGIALAQIRRERNTTTTSPVPPKRILISAVEHPAVAQSAQWLHDFFGFDVSAFFQGTGNHYWYPHVRSFAFWGPFSQPMCSYLPKDFLANCWSENNPDAYFPRPVAYLAYDGGAQLNKVNSRYLQNLRYLRFKNLTVGYTLPQKATKKIGIDRIRLYFSGENLEYWSPFKKNSIYIDPEGAFGRSNNDYNRAFYPWQKTYMFGIDVTF